MKILVKTASLLLAAAFVLTGLTACGGDRPGRPDTHKFDKKMTQLYIANYGGGFGERWLNDYITLFEKKMKTKSYEPGKEGVQVFPQTNPDMYSYGLASQQMLNSNMNLYFTESVDYFDGIRNNRFADISDVYGYVPEGEKRSIGDKVFPEQKEILNVDGKYYAIPTYQTFRGLVYDVDMFNEKKLYFNEEGKIGEKLDSADKSTGPNGKKGDFDDGLPRTYDEFFRLCEQIKGLGCTPICWTGEHRVRYAQHLLEALYVDAQGKDEYNLRFTLGEGDAKECDVITGFDESGNPVTERITINKDNYKMVTRQKGLYYALSFLERIIDDGYYSKDSFGDTISHVMNHYNFLHSKDDGSKRIAMMLEGTWWEEEADPTFKEMGDGNERYTRKFGFMPLPKAPGQPLSDQVLYNANHAYAFINSNCDKAHLEVAKDFLKFIHSDEMLRLFTSYTGVSKDLDYTLTDAEKSKLSYYSQTVYEAGRASIEAGRGLVLASDVSQESAVWRVKYYQPMIDNPYGSKITINGEPGSYYSPVDAFHDYPEELTARAYFEGMYDILP